MNSIAKAFVAAKKEFSPLLKEKTNPHFRTKYADLGACLEAVDDALLNHGIAVYQETHESDSGVTVETVFLHESGESLRAGKLHVPATKNDPQGFGSALTYARRYSLMAACGIAADDDDGNRARPTAPQQAQPLQQPRQAKPAPAALLEKARAAAASGTPAYEEFWKAASNEEKRALLGEHENLKRAAAEAQVPA